jgi:hypothetical protein
LALAPQTHKRREWRITIPRHKPSRRHGQVRTAATSLLILLYSAWAGSAEIVATRFPENPLITVHTSPSLGDNVNGPAVIRVPDWVERPLGRYYMYFAHHKGLFIRMAYADSLHGPWKVYEPGVLNVEDTAFFRPQPDPDPSPPGAYTHIASPEIYVDQSRRRIVMWFHGMWTEGRKWPTGLKEASNWLRQNGYAQFTQTAESSDGLHFRALAPITKQIYLRVFPVDDNFYAMSRLGQLLRAGSPLVSFETGPNPFRDGPYSGRVRHVALLPIADSVSVFFSAIGDAPEKILHTTIPLEGDWSQWRTSGFDTVLEPQTPYECPDLPVAPSEVGEIHGPARQLRDPALYQEAGKIYLFYTICGEQGIAGAEVSFR